MGNRYCCTLEDITGLARWVDLFGSNYHGLLVFMYQLQPTVNMAEDTEDLWTWRGSRYLLRAIDVVDYRGQMRQRSPRWGTVGLPGAAFRELVRPFFAFIDDKQEKSESRNPKFKTNSNIECHKPQPVF